MIEAVITSIIIIMPSDMVTLHCYITEHDLSPLQVQIVFRSVLTLRCLIRTLQCSAERERDKAQVATSLISSLIQPLAVEDSI